MDPNSGRIISEDELATLREVDPDYEAAKFTVPLTFEQVQRIEELKAERLVARRFAKSGNPAKRAAGRGGLLWVEEQLRELGLKI